MIYALKLLFAVLLVIGLAVVAYRGTFKDLLQPKDYYRAWTLVVVCMLACYLCKFAVIFMLVLGGLALWATALMGGTPVAALCAYLLLGIIVPPISLDIGGVGGINKILVLDHYRMLALAALVLPAAQLALAKKTPGYGRLLWLDLAVLSYPLLRIVLALPYSTTTTTARSFVEMFLDLWLPYYVATRAIRTFADLRRVATYIAVGVLFGATIGFFEELIQHNLFTGLEGVYGTLWQLLWVQMRGGLIRVQAMTQTPIILAIVMVFGLGFWVWLRGRDWRKWPSAIGFVALLGTLVFTWSRGPWLAAIVLFFMLLAIRKLPPRMVRLLLALGILAGVVLKSLGADQAVTVALQSLFGGDTEDLSTIDYRRELLDTSLALIKQSPWLGVPDYASQMQDLRQGQGIIDIVNTYVAVMLDTGVVGLFCFLAPFVIVLHRLIGAIRRTEGGAMSEGSRFAMAMTATTVAVLFAIFTTSTFGLIPLMLTLLVALPGAWLAMPAREREPDAAPRVEEVVDPLRRYRRTVAIRPYAP